MLKRNLTEHELAVLELSEGKTSKQLAAELSLGEQGIKQILSRVYLKLNVKGKEHALRLARRRKLIPNI
jgi:DNA-binding CsgD family transcriptional regulator